MCDVQRGGELCLSPHLLRALCGSVDRSTHLVCKANQRGGKSTKSRTHQLPLFFRARASFGRAREERGWKHCCHLILCWPAQYGLRLNQMRQSGFFNQLEHCEHNQLASQTCPSIHPKVTRGSSHVCLGRSKLKTEMQKDPVTWMTNQPVSHWIRFSSSFADKTPCLMSLISIRRTEPTKAHFAKINWYHSQGTLSTPGR